MIDYDPPSLDALSRLEEEHGIRLRRLDTIEPEPYRWLWRHRVPQSAITILNGKPDAGKSTVYTDLAARVSTGTAMPCETEQREPRNVIILATEDSYSEVVRPRLEAAKADLSRVTFIEAIDDGTPLLTPGGLRQLAEASKVVRPGLLVVDPFTNYLPPEVDSHLDQHVRRVLNPLNEIAKQMRCAVLVVRHHALGYKRGAGSVGIGGIARSELTLTKTKAGDGGVLTVSKRNNAPAAVAVHYTFVGVGDVARLEWSASPEADDNPQRQKATPNPTDDRDRSALLQARDSGTCSGAQLATLLGVGLSTADRVLRGLEIRGLLVKRGDGRGRELTAAGREFIAAQGW